MTSSNYQADSKTNNNVKLKKVANAISRMKLEMPAVFFLEAHKPLTTLCHTASLFLQPIATPLFGAERVNGLVEILADKNSIDKLIELIESGEVEQEEMNN